MPTDYVKHLPIQQYKQEQTKNPLYPLWVVVHGWGHPGYTWFAVASDGALLCEACCRKEYRQIVAATRDKDHSGWRIVGFTYTGEMEEEETCAHCNKILNPSE